MAVYTVRPGDTLSAIAVAHGISLGSLVAANPNIANPDLIFVGQNITIPGGTPANPFNDPLQGHLGDPGDSPANPVQPPGSPFVPPTFPSPPAGGPLPGGGGGGSNPPSGGVPEVPSAEDIATNNFGLIEFSILTADGPVSIPIFFPPIVWEAIMDTPLGALYGFDVGVTQVPIGQSAKFLENATTYLQGNPLALSQLQEKLSSLELFDEIDAGAGDLPPVSPEMAATGIAWVVDPATGQPQLIDTQPFYGPPVSSFKFVPLDPNSPTAGGTWSIVQDPNIIGRSIFEGVPKSVEPWLQAALDAGGDTSGIPEGPAKAWVDFIIGQAQNSSARPPTELPFGLGLPDFGGGLGSDVPPFPTPDAPANDTGSGSGSGDSGPVPTPTPETVVVPPTGDEPSVAPGGTPIGNVLPPPLPTPTSPVKNVDPRPTPRPEKPRPSTTTPSVNPAFVSPEDEVLGAERTLVTSIQQEALAAGFPQFVVDKTSPELLRAMIDTRNLQQKKIQNPADITTNDPLDFGDPGAPGFPGS